MVAHDRFLKSGTNLHEVPSLEEERQVVATSSDDDVDPGLATQVDDWDFDGLVTVNQMERTDVGEESHDVQVTCRAENMSVATTVLADTDLAAHVVSVRKQKAALKRRNARVLLDFDGLREDLNARKRMVEGLVSCKHAMQHLVAALKEEGLEKVTTGREATRDTEPGVRISLRQSGLVQRSAVSCKPTRRR